MKKDKHCNTARLGLLTLLLTLLTVRSITSVDNEGNQNRIKATPEKIAQAATRRNTKHMTMGMYYRLADGGFQKIWSDGSSGDQAGKKQIDEFLEDGTIYELLQNHMVRDPHEKKYVNPLSLAAGVRYAALEYLLDRADLDFLRNLKNPTAVELILARQCLEKNDYWGSETGGERRITQFSFEDCKKLAQKIQDLKLPYKGTKIEKEFCTAKLPFADLVKWNKTPGNKKHKIGKQYWVEIRENGNREFVKRKLVGACSANDEVYSVINPVTKGESIQAAVYLLTASEKAQRIESIKKSAEERARYEASPQFAKDPKNAADEKHKEHLKLYAGELKSNESRMAAIVDEASGINSALVNLGAAAEQSQFYGKTITGSYCVKNNSDCRTTYQGGGETASSYYRRKGAEEQIRKYKSRLIDLQIEFNRLHRRTRQIYAGEHPTN